MNKIMKSAVNKHRIRNPIFLIIATLFFIGAGWYFNQYILKVNRSTLNNYANPSPEVTIFPTVEHARQVRTLKTVKLTANINPSAKIRVPFSRNGSIYIYEDGVEILLAKQEFKSTSQQCNNLVHPLMSPSGRYIAYIEQTGS